MPRARQPYNPAKVHDRRATETGRKSEVAPIVVDDPWAAGDKIAVMRNLRDDPLARLHSKGTIDEAQFQAGRAFQHDWETASRGPRAIDPGKEAVDGGRMPDPITDTMRRAVARLALADRRLGQDGSALARDVLIERRSYRQIAERHGMPGKKLEEYLGLRFRECLNRLAVVYSFASSN